MPLIASAHLTSGNAPFAQHIRAGSHSITADEPAAHGGGDAGPTPFGLVLSGLAACTSVTLAMYAQRKSWTLGQLRVDLRLTDDDGTMRIERVLTFDAAVPADQRARLAEIAEKTPVTKALRAGFTIETRIAA